MTTLTPEQIERLREQFESWFASEYKVGKFTFERHNAPLDDYVSGIVQARWQGYLGHAAMMVDNPISMDQSVGDITDAELIQRAVTNCRARSAPQRAMHPRWVAVMDTFALGSTYSRQLCVRFGADPYEMVR